MAREHDQSRRHMNQAPGLAFQTADSVAEKVMEYAETLVFVYGTLRKGCSNHHYLRSARFLGQARTRERYALYVGRYPYVYRQANANDASLAHIVGEVYALDAACLAAVDRLEDHPRDYCREQVQVVLESGEVLRVWLYFHPHPEGRLLPSGDVLAPLCHGL